MNADRKKGGDLNKVTYEAFEIIMDRLEKEWFDLVRILCVHLCLPNLLSFSPTQWWNRRRIYPNKTLRCHQKIPHVLYATTPRARIVMRLYSVMDAIWLYIRV